MSTPDLPPLPASSLPEAGNHAKVGRHTPWKARTINLAIVLGTMLTAATAVAGHDVRVTGGAVATWSNATMGLWFLGVGFGVIACFRQRARVWIPLALAVPPLFLELDTLPTLVAMASALVWVTQVQACLAVWAASTVSTYVAVYRSTRGGPAGSSFFNDVLAGDPQAAHPSADMPWWQVLITTALIVGVFTAVALIRRARLDTQHYQQVSDAAMADNLQLQSQTAHLLEREDIAREVHDVLGHRLSMLSMQAGMLEVKAEATGEAALANQASLIQQGAAGSMDDLRSLLALLRQQDTVGASPADINDIAGLIREVVDAGTPINSNVFVQNAETLSPLVSRSAHRIIAELLTNVRKHAGGESATLSVAGNPQDGLSIQCSNRVPTTVSAGLGTGSGLGGVERRVTTLHGEFSQNVDQRTGQYIVRIWLPWNPINAYPTSAR